ncbi:MAG TPA: ABC transporter permease [Bryobacteraceae bacterium]|nr:ABC transporter permease [Bryobacteraceae bacterium]
MRTLRRWLMRARGLFGRERIEREFAAELASHLELHIDEGVRAGLSPGEARRQALVMLGGLAPVQELYREQRGLPVLENLVRDFVYSLRLLRKSPGFTAVAILSLALGIGANTAMFSLVNAVLLRALPYPESGRLLHTVRDVTLPEYEALKQQSAIFSDVAGRQGPSEKRLDYGDRREWIAALRITPEFFRTLNVPLSMGGEFTSTTADRTVILSHDLWRRLMQARPDAVGQVVALDGKAYMVAGVAAPHLWLPDQADAFIPLNATGGFGDLGANTQVISRLAPGVDRRQANSAAAAAAGIFRRAYPEYARQDQGIALVPFQEWLTGDVRGKLLLLSGAVGLVLSIACFNLIGLLLARLSARQREISVRLALGCSRGRLLQQFLMENLLVCIAGGVAGVLGAYWLLDFFLAILPFPLPSAAPIRVDLPVLAFAAGITLVAGLLVTLAPAWMFSQPNIQGTLKQSARGVGERTGLRSILVVSEIAAATALLIGAALFLHSLYLLNRQPLGFTPEGLLTFFAPPEPGAGAARNHSLISTLHEQFSGIPGVRRVAAVNVLPLAGKNNFPAQRAGHPEQSIGGMEIRLVTPDYFETMSTPLRRGRCFTALDTEQTVPVVLINEALSRQWWPHGNAIGDRIEVGTLRGKPVMREATREVIGVIGDMRILHLAEPARPTLYIPIAQARWYDGGMNWVIRADAGKGFAEVVRRKVKEVAPGQRIERMRSMEQIIATTTANPRFDAVLFGSFAASALLLAALGVYGLLAFSVAKRTSEIGIRMALGASPGQVLRLVLSQGLQLVAFGLAMGIAGALILGRYLSNLLFGISPADPLSFAAVAAVLSASGFLASYLPARRAMRVDPLQALRCE